MPTIIKNQPTSKEVIARLKAENRPVLVAFSGGKDAIATTLALREAGIETILVHMYVIPPIKGKLMPLVDESLTYFEEVFDTHIYRYPHPSIARWLTNFVFQPPERCAVIEACEIPVIEYDDLWKIVREELDLPDDTWVADGVRAADSIVRRTAFVRHGVMKKTKHKVSPIADWLKAEVMDIIERHNINLPADYELFNRSFDGIDYRFIAPLKEYRPADFEHILHWFPLAELELQPCRLA